MKSIMELFRRFGGATLIESLPGIHDFNERLRKSAQLSQDLEVRIEAMEVDLANQGRIKKLPLKREMDDYSHD